MPTDSRASTNESSRLLLTCAGAVSLVWFSAWLAGLIIDPSNWPVRYFLFGVGFVMAVGSFSFWACRFAREQRSAWHYFQVLGKMRQHELIGDGAADLPPLPAWHPWAEVAQACRDNLQTSSQKLQQAESARATLEVRLKRSLVRQQQVEAVLASLAEPIVAVDQYDELMLVNPSAEKLFDLGGQDPENRALSQLVHCEQLVDLLTETRRRRSPSQRTGELELTDPQGNSHCYSVTARSLPSGTESADDGPTQGAVAVLRDISGLKSVQKRNADFVSAVSHEMKTPLAGIKAYVELLVDGEAEDDQTREEFLNVINSQANRLQRLIENLLNIARIEAGVVSVSKQSRSLNELLEETLSIVRPAAEAKKIDLVADLSKLYLGVLADRDMMTQAAINLLSNAVKYTPDGGRVVLRSRLEGSNVLFEVEDTGVGLSEEDREKVFEKFYRVKKDREMASGTGLGLPLAKHIVEDVHGGRITVESKLGQGSTFRVTLPSAGARS